jgi:hypothetical protein
MKGHKEEDQSQKMSNAGRGFGHGRSRGGDRRRIRTSKENVECYKCHKLRHYQSECPNLEENANNAEFDDEKELLLILMLKKSLKHDLKTRYGFLILVATII